MRIYHTETQEDYDELMVELEAENYVWSSGYRPTEWRKWSDNGKDTCIAVQDKLIYYSNTSFYNQFHPDIPIVEYKLKFTKENVVVPKCFDDWYKEIENEYQLTDITKTFALWKLCHQGFGYSFERVNGEKICYKSELGKWLLENKMQAINAVLNGYTIEPDAVTEQHYTVVIADRYLVQLFMGRKDYRFVEFGELWAWEPDAFQLTEAEIKAIDERYWTFAVPVKEEAE